MVPLFLSLAVDASDRKLLHERANALAAEVRLAVSADQATSWETCESGEGKRCADVGATFLLRTPRMRRDSAPLSRAPSSPDFQLHPCDGHVRECLGFTMNT